MKIKQIKSIVYSLAIILGSSLSNSAQADSIVIKAYKKDFPDAQLKCANCHMASVPWEHPWNAYGRAIKSSINATGVGEVPSQSDESKIADAIKKIGRSENFKASPVKQ